MILFDRLMLPSVDDVALAVQTEGPDAAQHSTISQFKTQHHNCPIPFNGTIYYAAQEIRSLFMG